MKRCNNNTFVKQSLKSEVQSEAEKMCICEFGQMIYLQSGNEKYKNVCWENK